LFSDNRYAFVSETPDGILLLFDMQTLRRG
jgi:hypothetical protein